MIQCLPLKIKNGAQFNLWIKFFENSFIALYTRLGIFDRIKPIFDNLRTKIVDFLLTEIFWPSRKFWEYPSTLQRLPNLSGLFEIFMQSITLVFVPFLTMLRPCQLGSLFVAAMPDTSED